MFWHAKVSSRQFIFSSNVQIYSFVLVAVNVDTVGRGYGKGNRLVSLSHSIAQQQQFLAGGLVFRQVT